ncbi:MAG: hypothetical protein Q9216_005340 [Gyalolechia sp. 2 TL-2023]
MRGSSDYAFNVRERRCNRISPAQIDTKDLTHLLFAYASIDPNNFSITSSHPDDAELYKQFNARKTKSLQTWIVVDGFDNSIPDGQTWVQMAAAGNRRAQFIASLQKFMAQYGFQGVEIDWQYPSAGDRGGSPNDAVHLVALVKEMRQAWGARYGISVRLPADYWYLRGYDPKGMEPFVDFFGFMTYDLHGPWDSSANSWGSVVRPHTDIREIQNDTLPLWFAGMDPKKINLGLSHYGRGYTLADPNCRHTGCNFKGPSKPGRCTNSAGLLSSVEINDLIKQKNLQPETLPDTMSKQIVWDDQWVGYDDEETLAAKTNWAEQNCFGGTMIWSVDLNSGEGSGNTPDGVDASTEARQPSASGNMISTAARYTRSTSSGRPSPSDQSIFSSLSSGQTNPSGQSISSSSRTGTPGSIKSGRPSISSTVSGSTDASGPTKLTSSSKSLISSLSKLSIPSLSSKASTRLSSSKTSTPPPSSKTSVVSTPGQSGQSTLNRPSASKTSSLPPSSKTSVTSVSSQPSQATSSTQMSFKSPTSSGSASMSSPTIIPGIIVGEGASAVLALLPLAYGLTKGLKQSQQAITTLAESKSPKVEDANSALEVLTGVGISLSILGATIPKLNVNSLPQDSKPIIQNLAKSIPSFKKGIEEAIDDLTNAVKDPKDLNVGDIRKAEQLLGKQSSVTQQVTETFKQLTDWKPPKGIGDIILDSATLPSPSVGDGWKGTTVNQISVPSPSVNWNKPSSSSSMEGFKDLGQQAVNAVEAASSSLGLLSGLASASFSDFSNLLGLLTSAAQDVGGLGAVVDGIELNTLNAAEIPRVVEIQNANRALYTELQDTLNDIARFITRPPQGLQSLKKRAPAYAAGGAVVALLAKGPSAVIGFHTQTKATSASPAPAEVTETKGADEFFLTTVPGTTVEAFQKFIEGLPDKGIGRKGYLEWPSRYQTYVTRMTLEEAKVVNQIPIVNVIGPNKKHRPRREKDWRSGRKDRMFSNERTNKTKTKVKQRQVEYSLETRLESDLHLRMLSAKPDVRVDSLANSENDPQYDYAFDKSMGQGVAVYVQDEAFDFSHQEFDRGPGLRPETHIASLLGNVLLNRPDPVHGSQVSALVVGDLVGVANKATLVAVKDAAANGDASWDATYQYMMWILSDIKAKNRQGKAVYCLTASEPYEDVMPANKHVNYARWNVIVPEKSDFYVQLLVDLWEADVVTVVPAGNTDTGETIGDSTPQRFGNPRNPLITVGSVDRSGKKSDFNRIQAPSNTARGRDRMLTGDISIYAMGEDVSIPTIGTLAEYEFEEGTSFSTPQIAGLAAYFLALPYAASRFSQPQTVAQSVKDLMMAEKRTRALDGWDVAYNGIHGAPCNPGEQQGPSRRSDGLERLSGWSDYDLRILKRQPKKGDTVTVFQNGQLTDPKYSDMVVFLYISLFHLVKNIDSFNFFEDVDTPAFFKVLHSFTDSKDINYTSFKDVNYTSFKDVNPSTPFDNIGTSTTNGLGQGETIHIALIDRSSSSTTQNP